MQGEAAGASNASAQAATGPQGLKRLRKAEADAPQQVFYDLATVPVIVNLYEPLLFGNRGAQVSLLPWLC